MGIGVSLILVAVGAILPWAVSAEIEGIDLGVVGVVLMIVGLAGQLLSMMFWSSWGGPAGMRRRSTYVDEGPPVARDPYGRRSTTTYVEEDDRAGPPPGAPGPPPPP